MPPDAARGPHPCAEQRERALSACGGAGVRISCRLLNGRRSHAGCCATSRTSRAETDLTMYTLKATIQKPQVGTARYQVAIPRGPNGPWLKKMISPWKGSAAAQAIEYQPSHLGNSDASFIWRMRIPMKI